MQRRPGRCQSGRFWPVDTALDTGVTPRPLPVSASASAEVARRRDRIVRARRGRVLDLDDPRGRAVLADAVGRSEVPASAPYDAIIATGSLTTWPDLHAVLVAADRLLADDGELLLVEPVDHPGVWGLLERTIGSWLPQGRGRHLSRDVVGTVRSVGLTVADVDRFTIPTWVWPLRRWVDLRAVRIPRRVGLGESAAPA